MTETDIDQRSPNRRVYPLPQGLPEAEATLGIDPCDLAFEAMPAHVLGDLPPTDEAWLREHVAGCSWCARQLDRYGRLGTVLDVCCAPPADVAPPPVMLPTGCRRHGGASSRSAETARAWTRTIDSPVGPLLLAATDRGLCEIAFARNRSEQELRAELAERGLDAAPASEAPPAAAATLAATAAQLADYFAGKRHTFDLPLDYHGVTPFTRTVLDATAGIGFGRLETYRGVAARLGNPGAARAVGNALGRNPLPVVVPCHRVVRAGGRLGGYTGGLGIKERLLALEGSAVDVAPGATQPTATGQPAGFDAARPIPRP